MEKTSKEYVRKKLKPEFLKKLDELGVFDEWYRNWVGELRKYWTRTDIDELNSRKSFNKFMLSSFTWCSDLRAGKNTDERHNFWEEISKK